MYPALLLPLLFAAAPGEPAATPPSVPAIQIWLNNDRRFFPGDQGRVQVQTLEDGYLVVLHVDPDGHLRVVFPVDPTDDNFIRGGKKYEVRGRGGRETFDVDNRTGHGTIYAAVSKSAFRFDDFVVGDHWDYKTIAPNRLPEDPESDVTELVRKMSQGSFDYDLLGYDVIEHVYASSGYYDNSSYASVYYGSSWCCSGISFGFSFGYPYRYPYYYPILSGLLVSVCDSLLRLLPLLRLRLLSVLRLATRTVITTITGTIPITATTTAAVPYYRGRYSPRVNPLDNYRYRGYQTANGFRGVSGGQGVNADYRDRRYTFRSDNTVYTPPGRRVAGAEFNSPLRRSVDSRTSVADNAADRSTTGSRRATSAEPAGQREARRSTGGEARGNTGTEARGNTGTERRRNTGSQDHPTPSVDRHRVETPGSVEARRARPVDVARVESPAVGDRSNWPVDVSPRRSTDAGQAGRGQTGGQGTEIVARRAYSRDGYDAAGDFSPERVASPSRSGGSDDGARRASGGDSDNRGGSSDYDGGRRASGGDYQGRPSGGDSDGGRRASGGDNGGGQQASGGGQRASGGDYGGGRRSSGGGRAAAVVAEADGAVVAVAGEGAVRGRWVVVAGVAAVVGAAERLYVKKAPGDVPGAFFMPGVQG